MTVDGKVKKACKLKPIPEEIQLVKTIFEVLLREPVSINTSKIVLTSWISSGMGLSLHAFFTLPSTVTLDRL